MSTPSRSGQAASRRPAPPGVGDQVRAAWSAAQEWLRQSTRAPARPTMAATISVLLCTSCQTLFVARLLFDGTPMDGAAAALTREWYGTVGVAVVVIGAAVLLMWRSSAPLAVLSTECTLYVAASVAGMHDFLMFPLLFALFSCVARPPARRIVTGVGAVAAAMTFSAAVVTGPGRFGAEYLGQLVLAVSVIALAIAARSIHSWRLSRSRAAADERRAQLLTRQRDRAVSRARVAAELHDSVGHGLTTIIALAEGLAGTTGDPTTDRALDGINTVARECLNDTRRAVRALAEDDHDAEGTLLTENRTAEDRPAPDRTAEDTADSAGAGPSPVLHDWADVSTVIDHVRALGVPVVFTETGRRPADPSQADLCFAVTREAVTNAVRHGRELMRIGISWDHAADGTTTTTIRNTTARPASRGAGAVPRAVPEAAERTQGTGLRRLRDRVESLGGTLTFGPSDEDEWTVTATVRCGSARPVVNGLRFGERS